MEFGLVDPHLEINNVLIGYVPDSFCYAEGFGAQGIVKFQLYDTECSIELAREWQNNKNNNVIFFEGQGNTNFKRIMCRAKLTNNYVVHLKCEGTLSLEFYGDPLICTIKELLNSFLLNN